MLCLLVYIFPSVPFLVDLLNVFGCVQKILFFKAILGEKFFLQELLKKETFSIEDKDLCSSTLPTISHESLWVLTYSCILGSRVPWQGKPSLWHSGLLAGLEPHRRSTGSYPNIYDWSLVTFFPLCWLPKFFLRENSFNRRVYISGHQISLFSPLTLSL